MSIEAKIVIGMTFGAAGVAMFACWLFGAQGGGPVFVTGLGGFAGFVAGVLLATAEDAMK